MRRDGIICGVIFAYCLAVAVYAFHPAHLLADTAQVSAQPVVTAPVRFDVLSESPDPNQILELVNKERVFEGSPAMNANATLGKIAAERAADMAKRQYYAHRNPEGKIFSDYFAENGIKTDYSCENLDAVFVPDINTFIHEWMASTKGHHECMMNPNFKDAGYAATKMTLVDYQGKPTPMYLVVAIHTTELK